MENISRKERDGHWHIPGKTQVEKQHLSEHETLQMLQRHALNGKEEEFYSLLDTIDGDDKRRDIMELCNMMRSHKDTKVWDPD